MAAARLARAIYRRIPLSVETRLRFKTLVFRLVPFLVRDTVAYRAWEAQMRTLGRLREWPSSPANVEPSVAPLPSWFYDDAGTEYVPITDTPGVATRIKAIAFYLPQFHPIPENDRWWGRGFTEWSNVARGKPQFAGHHQPHLPGELGFYDLRLIEVQRRQIELAKMYGVYGFCYHHYWFDGTRLLRQPLDQLLANPDLDFPFCLCWANENWTRRWDGEEDEILFAQRHSPGDDLAFIRDIEPALRDPRYIRVGDRPLLVVYRPGLLPDARSTAMRWREYCRQAGIGELFLMSTQAFDRRDPSEFGFDAAMEFAPNNLGAPAITSQLSSVNPRFKGTIYDYNYLVEYSRHYEPVAYPLFRSVTPMWDNEARRPGRGSVFANSSPARYAEWLENASRYADERFGSDRPFVFLNAWNEWAEGAHLEPDRRYGYAYLEATARALRKFPENRHRPSIVVVSHDACFHGAQHVALKLARTLSGPLGFDVHILLCGDGPLREAFAAVGHVHDFFAPASTRGVQLEILRGLYEGGARLALCNTSVVGETAELLKGVGFTVISLIHELPGVIQARGLETSVQRIARDADHLVFPAEIVRERFLDFTGVPFGKTVVRPQGLLAKNRFRGRRSEARHDLRVRLDLSEGARIVLAVGYADRRKGLDLFVEVGLELLKTRTDVTFVWVGHHEMEAFLEAQARVAAAGAAARFLFPGLVEHPDVFFAGADVYLMTSREDPFPLVVLDALEAELPVVGFEGAGGFSELLERGCGVLVPYLDTNAMAAAADRILTDATLRQRLATEGRRIIEREFDFEDYARFLIGLMPPTKPTVSVIVPNYNYARFLPSRLGSILSQTFTPHEIIFLDDCSSDNSVAVADRVLGKGRVPFRIIRNEANQGCYRQWLRGLREAAGELIWIAEADDDCAPQLLETLVQAFEQKTVVLAYCQSRQIGDDGQELAPDYLAWTEELSATKWRHGYVRAGLAEVQDTLSVKNAIPNVSAVLMRRPDLSAIEAKLVDLRNAGDWLVYVHLLENGDIAFVPASLNYHRRHRRSVTIGQGGLNLMREIMLVQQHVRERHEIPPDVELKRMAFLQSTYQSLGLDAKGPARYEDHEALRSLASSVAD